MHRALAIALFSLLIALGATDSRAESKTGVFEKIRASEYHFRTAGDGEWSAPNRAGNLRTRVSGTGLRVEPREETTEAFELELELIEWGRGDSLRAVPRGQLQADGRSIRIDREQIVEWLINDERGVEHGFDIASPPLDGEGPLVLRIRLGGLLAYPLDERSVRLVHASGKHRLAYRDLLVIDAGGRELPARFELDSSRLDIVIDDGDAIYPLVVDPLITSAGWSYVGNANSAQMGRSVSTAGDVNGDGYSDLLVSAPMLNVGSTGAAGKVFLFLGSASGPQTTPAWTYSGSFFLGELGASVSTAGDINRDGYDDVVIGEPGAENGLADQGEVRVFYGGPGTPPLNSFPNWKKFGPQAGARFGAAVAYAGDVNGDGYADIVVGAPNYDNPSNNEGGIFVYPGGPSGLSGNAIFTAESNRVNAHFGAVVSTAGDVNGDGHDDVLVGAPDYTTNNANAGRMYFYYGTATSMVYAGLRGGADQIGGQFGASVSTAGDINGDGYADVIVGEPGYDGGQSNEGRAVIHLGSPSGLESQVHTSIESNRAGSMMGSSVATAGDVNGDGYADIVIGADRWTNGQSSEGLIQVYLGRSVSGVIFYGSIESNIAGAEFGGAVATAGDMDGDGLSDLVVGAPAFTDPELSEGKVFWYRGDPDGLGNGGLVQTGGSGSQLGFSMDSGDFNADGFSDLIVGAPFFDAGDTDNGKAYIYYGDADGISAPPDWETTGEADDEHGYAVASAGDVDGNGFDDVLIGQPGRSFQTGRARLYLSGPAGTATTSSFGSSAPSSLSRAGAAIAGLGDVNGDGLADFAVGAPGYAFLGRFEVYYGSTLGTPIRGLEFDGTAGNESLGFALAAAGDVDRDGYNDLLVGDPGCDSGSIDGGCAYLFRGGPAGLSSAPDWVRESTQAGGRYGTAVAGIGDFNRDTYSDFVISAPLGEESTVIDEGLVYVYRGTAGVPAFVNYIRGGSSGARIGGAVSSAGDVNNDGYSELAIGSPDGDTPRLTVWYGSASWSFPSPSFSDSSLFEFGASITHGDWNGDGYGDLAVGAPGWTTATVAEGAVWVFYGNGGRKGRPVRLRQAFGDFAQSVALMGRAGDLDEFGSIVNGFTPEGTGRLRLQFEARPIFSGFDGTLHSSTGWGETTSAATSIEFSHLLDQLTPSAPYKWRVRMHRANPLFPRSPWFTMPGNASTETDIQLRCQEVSWWRDDDGDGYGTASSSISACAPPPGFVADDTDCDDTNPDANPGLAPIDCDGFDNDCSGTPDAPDTDGDGFDVCDAGDPSNPDQAAADCAPDSADTWNYSEPILDLTMTQVGGVTRLEWSEPDDTGGLLLGYDVLRTDGPDQLESADCLANLWPDTTFDDAEGSGGLSVYLVLPVNECGGTVAPASEVSERLLPVCPN